MKTLRDYRVAGALLLQGSGVPASVGDQIKMFLDKGANAAFPISINGIIQHPITLVDCDSYSSYNVTYNEADLLGSALLLRPHDVIDATIISQGDILELLKANIASPTFTGIPSGPTAAPGTNTTQLATTAFVTAVDVIKAPLASPALTGIPTVPTAALGTSSTQAASTAFVGALLTSGLASTPQSLIGAGAVDVVSLTTALTSTGAAQALTLANGLNGQIKIIAHDVDGGSAVLTPTTKTGFTTITFTNVGETAMLQFFNSRGWMILSLRGAVAA